MKNKATIIGLAVLFFAAELRAQVFNNGVDVYISQNLKVSLSGNFVNAAGLLTNDGKVSAGNFTNQLGALTMGLGTFSLRGNFLNFGDFEGQSTLRFEGNGMAALQSNAANIHKIELAKTGAAPLVELLDDLILNEALVFSAPRNKLKINDFHLDLYEDTQISGYGQSRFIITNGLGMVRRGFLPNNVFVTFPVGATASTYNPLDLRNTGTLDDYAVRCLPEVLTNGGSGTPYASHRVAASWQISEGIPGGSLLTIYPQWNASDEMPSFSRSVCSVRRFNGSVWDFPSVGAATGGNPYKKGRGAVLETGFFCVSGALLSGDPTDVRADSLNVSPGKKPLVFGETALKIIAHPSPFQDFVTLEKLAAPDLDSRLLLRTPAGQTLRSFVWPSEDSTFRLNGSDLPAGLYFVFLDFGTGGRASLPIVKQ